MPISVLENTLAIQILLTLYKDGEMFRSILYNKVSKGTNTPRMRVDELIKAGLIDERISDFPPISKTITLSKIGREVAIKLMEIQKILSD